MTAIKASEGTKKIPLQERPLKEITAITCGGMLLAFNGGMLNSTTVSGARSLSTAPMTGASTSAGIGLGAGNLTDFGINIGLILCHILGAAVSGYIVPNRTFYLGSPYGRIFKAGSVVLAVAAITDQLAPESLAYYFLVAFMTGIQNAITSRYSGNILRTTHISGSVTDIGLIAGRTAHGQKQNLWKMYVNLCLVASFFLGAVVAGFTVKDLGRSQLFVNVGVFFLVGVLYTLFVKQEVEYRPVLRFFGCLPSLATSKEEEPPCEEPPSDEAGLQDVPPVSDTGANAIREVVAYDPISQPVELTADLSVPSSGNSSATSYPVTASRVEVEENIWTHRVMLAGICFLCINAGFINATSSLSSRGFYTSHITGTTTAMAIALADREFGRASAYVGLVIAYVVGAAICGTMVPSDFYSLKAPYGRVFIIGTMMLILAQLIHIEFPESYYFYYILAGFCGMQSALGCKIKGSVVRTTYMSGCATDIGAALGRRLKGGPAVGLRTVRLLLPSLLSFIFGSLIARLLFPLLGKYQIVVNIVGFSTLGCLYSLVQSRFYVLHVLWKTLFFKSDKGDATQDENDTNCKL